MKETYLTDEVAKSSFCSTFEIKASHCFLQRDKTISTIVIKI